MCLSFLVHYLPGETPVSWDCILILPSNPISEHDTEGPAVDELLPSKIEESFHLFYDLSEYNIAKAKGLPFKHGFDHILVFLYQLKRMHLNEFEYVPW